MIDDKSFNIFYTLYIRRSSVMVYKTHVSIYDISIVKSPFFDTESQAPDTSITSVTRSMTRSAEITLTRSVMKSSEASVIRTSKGVSKNNKKGLYACIYASLRLCVLRGCTTFRVKIANINLNYMHCSFSVA